MGFHLIGRRKRDLSRERRPVFPVIPAQAGTQCILVVPAKAGTQCARTLDCGLRRNDGGGVLDCGNRTLKTPEGIDGWPLKRLLEALQQDKLWP